MPVTQDDFPDIPKVTPLKPNFQGTFASAGWNKAQAAIALKVPCSGIPELDAMIRESRRLDMATAAMQGLINYSPEPEEHKEIAGLCFQLADALLAASEKEQMK